ncbi:hypothetical protein CCP4SC76_1890022 [Gammaproteobacteria bacterium]
MNLTAWEAPRIMPLEFSQLNLVPLRATRPLAHRPSFRAGGPT